MLVILIGTLIKITITQPGAEHQDKAGLQDSNFPLALNGDVTACRYLDRLDRSHGAGALVAYP